MGFFLAHHRLGSAVLQSGDHGLVLLPEDQGTTEQPEYTETKLNRARIPFRVFRVFGGKKRPSPVITYWFFAPKTREPRNRPNTRKQSITVRGFPSVCSVCSVV